MNDTDREKWKRVATRIGKWKPDERCLDMNCDHYATPHSYHSAPHDIPCPDPSDPAIIVAMLEWLLLNWIPSAPIVIVPRSHRNEEEGDYESEWHGGALPDALIDAIDALPEN